MLKGVFYHAGGAPDICGGTVSSSHQHLERTILPSLDVICEMFVLQGKSKVTACILHVLLFKLGQRALTKKNFQSSWMRGRNTLTTQQALPKSAILTCSLSALRGSRGFTNKLTAPVNDRIAEGDIKEERRGTMIKSS